MLLLEGVVGWVGGWVGVLFVSLEGGVGLVGGWVGGWMEHIDGTWMPRSIRIMRLDPRGGRFLSKNTSVNSNQNVPMPRETPLHSPSSRSNAKTQAAMTIREKSKVPECMCIWKGGEGMGVLVVDDPHSPHTSPTEMHAHPNEAHARTVE